MGPESEQLISCAFGKVEARYQAAGLTVALMPFEQFLREVIAEVCAEAGRRQERALRKLRKHSLRVQEAAVLIEVMGRSPVFGDTALVRWLAGPGADRLSTAAAAQAQQAQQDKRGAPVHGPPSWHPEHGDHPENL
jgi:hypothetical protein